MKRRLITSALPYVNNVPHLGNLIQVLSADVFARFCRIKGYNTLYICGTDEYGTATETRAIEEGISPGELCERYFKIHDDIYRWFNIAFDKFGRSSTHIHTSVTQDIFQKLDKNGYISEKTIEQLFCHNCSRFLADRFVLGTCPHCDSPNARGDQCEDCGKLLDPTDLKDPKCSVCSSLPKLESTNHLYINLPMIKDKLDEWIKTASIEGFWAHNALSMTQAWIRDGLRERGITRDLKWGIPVPKPGYENKVFYVWFDAPIAYISMTGNLAEDRGLNWQEFVNYWWKSPKETELFQFIGKDNIPFHTVIFPSSLLGSGDDWTMLHHMSSTEYMNYETGKFSKSRGIGVFGNDAMETGIPSDVWRFYIFYNRPEKSDTLFVWKDFAEKVNGQLIGNLGNLINRTLSFISRYYDNIIPEAVNATDNKIIKEWMDNYRTSIKKYEEDIGMALDRADLRDAFHLIFEMSSFANKNFQNEEPWKKRKAENTEPHEGPLAAEALIKCLAYTVRDLAILIHPYMPAAAEKIASFFGLTFGNSTGNSTEPSMVYEKKDGRLSWDDLGSEDGLKMAREPEIVFHKLEDELINTLRERYSGNQTDRESLTPNAVTYDENNFYVNMDLRTAKIVNIEKHPKADKLYIAKVETLNNEGEIEERQIVTGLVDFYSEEELKGKKIILAYNLKPAKIRGTESRGMLLAAQDHNGSQEIEKGLRVEVLDAADAPIGIRVEIEGMEMDKTKNAPSEIDIDTFFSFPMIIKDNIFMLGSKNLLLDGKKVKTSIIPEGTVH